MTNGSHFKSKTRIDTWEAHGYEAATGPLEITCHMTRFRGQTGRWKSEMSPHHLTSKAKQSKAKWRNHAVLPLLQSKASLIDAEGTEVENGKFLQIFEKRWVVVYSFCSLQPLSAFTSFLWWLWGWVERSLVLGVGSLCKESWGKDCSNWEIFVLQFNCQWIFLKIKKILLYRYM